MKYYCLLIQYHNPAAPLKIIIVNIRRARATDWDDETPYGARSAISAASRVPSPEGAIGKSAIIPVIVETEMRT